jgi:endonuclease YncB( thermonuclease family)
MRPALWLCLLLPLWAAAETLTGRVVKVTDGDTLTLLDASQTQHKIRLAGIDAPESRQPWGQRSKAALVALVAGEGVAVDWSKRDRYGRILGKVIVGGTDAGLAQIKAGLAWWYRRYASEQSPADRAIYAAAEAQALAGKKGLWGDPQPVAPWEWRRR